MNAKTMIEGILKEKGAVRQVYWVACGGSLIDLYPAHFMLNAESATVESGWYTSRDFLLSTPRKLGRDSMVVVCSHSGNTQEAVDAAILAHEMSMDGNTFGAGEGLVKESVEQTIASIGLMASQGMKETDAEILRIMIGSGSGCF